MCLEGVWSVAAQGHFIFSSSSDPLENRRRGCWEIQFGFETREEEEEEGAIETMIWGFFCVKKLVPLFIFIVFILEFYLFLQFLILNFFLQFFTF